MSPYLSPYLLAAATSLAIAAALWPRRRLPGGLPFVLLMLGAFLWAAANALELAAPTLEGKLFWARVQYLGKVSIPVAWLATALQYIDRDDWLTRRTVALLCVIPALTLVLVWTSGAHGLVIQAPHLVDRGPVTLVGKEYGPWFWVNIGYSYLLIGVATAAILASLLRFPHLYRGQAAAWLVAAAVPMASNLTYVFGVDVLRGLDLSPAAFAASGVALFWGFRRFHLFDLIPAARASVLESMSEGVLVLDARRRIIDANPAAARILGIELSRALGRPVGELVPELAETGLDRLGPQADADVAELAEVRLASDGGERVYELRASPLSERRRRSRGSLVLLLDVTEARRLQAELAARSLVDELTGLYNRRGFLTFAERRLRLARRTGVPATLVFADLDGLKQVNDSVGHAAGDRLLAAAAEVLRAAFRETDVVARLGGDEFAVLAFETGAGAHARLHARLEDALARQRAGGDRPVRFSVGMASFDPARPVSLDALLGQADCAMYEHKRARRQSGARSALATALALACALAALACGGAPGGDAGSAAAVSAPREMEAEMEAEVEPEPGPESETGRRCYALASETQTVAARLTLSADGRVSGEAAGTVHDHAEAYFTSYYHAFAGTRSGEQVDLEVVTWIEYDRRAARETWRLGAGRLDDGRTALGRVDCREVEERFAERVLERLATAGGELTVAEQQGGPEPVYTVRLAGELVRRIAAAEQEGELADFPLPTVLRRFDPGVAPFREVVLFQQQMRGNACNGGPLWLLGLGRDGSFAVSPAIAFCGGAAPVVTREGERIRIEIPGGPPNRGEGYLPGETWFYEAGAVYPASPADGPRNG